MSGSAPGRGRLGVERDGAGGVEPPAPFFSVMAGDVTETAEAKRSICADGREEEMQRRAERAPKVVGGRREAG